MCNFVQINTSNYKAITLRVVNDKVVVSSNVFIDIQKVCEALDIETKIVSITDEGILFNRQIGDISLKKNISPVKTLDITKVNRKYLVLFELNKNSFNLNSACHKLMDLLVDSESDNQSLNSESSISIIHDESSVSTNSSESSNSDSSNSDSSSLESDSSESNSSESDSSESNSSESFTCLAPVFDVSITTIDTAIGNYIQFNLTVNSNPLNPPQFELSNLPNGINSYQYSGGDFIIYGNPEDVGNFVIDVTAYYSDCPELQSQIQLYLNVSTACYRVSGTNTDYDDLYIPDQVGYVYYDYDQLTTIISNSPSPSGTKYIFRSQNNSNLAIFFHETYQIWAISDLSTYNSGPPDAGLINGNNGAPPTGNWYSPTYSTAVSEESC
jgi:hypothetical protein